MKKLKYLLTIIILLGLATSTFGQIDKGIQIEITLNNVDKVLNLIEENPELLDYKIIGIRKESLNLLGWAVAMGAEDVAEMLIQKGFDVNWKTSDGQNLLHLAADYLGDSKVTRLLLEKGVDPNTKSTSGKMMGITPLHLAAGFGHLAMVKILIESGADLESTVSGKTPLHMAVESCQDTIVDLLIKEGADVNIKDINGISPLLYLRFPPSQQGSLLKERFRLLKSKVEIKNPTEFTVLVGLRSKGKGINFPVKAKDKTSVYVPYYGQYDIYLLYTNEPLKVYQGKRFSPSKTIKLSKNPQKSTQFSRLNQILYDTSSK